MLISVLVLVFRVVGMLYLVVVFSILTNIHEYSYLAISIIVLALVLASILDEHSCLKFRS